MIICHCHCIASEAIETATCALAEADPWCLLTPVQVYRSLGKRPRCGGCLPLAQQIIHRCVAEQRACAATCPLLQPAPADAPAEALSGCRGSWEPPEVQRP